MNYFGTDGIRGEVGKILTPELITALGQSAATVFAKNGIKKIIIGMDPRISSQSIMDILAGNLQLHGIDVEVLGVVSTPVISYGITNNENIDAGIMISASHNPYSDNGIKFFGSNGQKISAKIEEAIESGLNHKTEIVLEKIGHKHLNETIVNEYCRFLVEQGVPLKNRRIGLDCAHGSSFWIAKNIFEKLGASVKVIGDQPTGYNINDNIGSTHPEAMQKLVVEEQLDFGFCYDGDADRVQLIDNTGELLDGDYILYLLARKLKTENKLTNNQVVSTVMSNLGYKKAIKELGIENLETPVGDKYVMAKMAEAGSSLGGEQSGHIILSEYITTGDGILTSVILSSILVDENFSFNKLKLEMPKFPQILHNHRCVDKNKIMKNQELLEMIKNENKQLGNEGRVLVRASGTENLIRIMVESSEISQCEQIISKIMEKVVKI